MQSAVRKNKGMYANIKETQTLLSNINRMVKWRLVNHESICHIRLSFILSLSWLQHVYNSTFLSPSPFPPTFPLSRVQLTLLLEECNQCVTVSVIKTISSRYTPHSSTVMHYCFWCCSYLELHSTVNLSVFHFRWAHKNMNNVNTVQMIKINLYFL